MHFRIRHLIIVTCVASVMLTIGVAIRESSQPKPLRSFSATVAPVESVYGNRIDKTMYVTTPPLARNYDGPAWLKSQPNPPVSTEEAIELAIAKRDSLELAGTIPKPFKGFTWHLVRIELVPGDPSVGYWYWKLLFQQLGENFEEPSRPASLTIVVLMDGHVVQPLPQPPNSGGIF